MRTADLAGELGRLPGLESIFNSTHSAAHWQSLAYEARPVLIAAEWRRAPRKTLIVTASYDRALAWQAKLTLCGIPAESIHQLPSGSSALFEDATPEHIALSDRLGALRALVEDDACIVVASPQAALERTLPRDVLIESHVDLQVGQESSIPDLIDRLVNLGYEPQEPVRIPGQYSRRGGILDIFATGHETPIRLEFFGDEIESMRRFDPNTQRSIGAISRLSLSPSRETIYHGPTREMVDLILSSLQREASMLDTEAASRMTELVEGDAEALAAKTYFDRLDLYRPFLHPDSGCAVDLLQENDWLILDEPLELEAIAARTETELGQALAARSERGELLHSTANDFVLPAEHLGTHARVLTLTAMDAVPSWAPADQVLDVEAVSLESYRGRAEALAMTLRNYREQGLSLYFTTDQPVRAKTVLGQIELFPGEEPVDLSVASQVGLLHGNLGGGFVLPNLKIAVVSDAELFGVARLRLPQKRFMEGAPIATVLDLKPGDFVVHIHFGIGIFRGLVTRSVEGVEKEFLFLEYQAPDKLFVPADQLDRVQKYMNPGDEQPKLNRLTGTEWQRTLGKAREDAKAFARDLVKLYASRKAVVRRPYGPDSPFQHEMEQTFPWVETPSQMRAIQEVKLDLEQGFPMDRLVCGDVGFGKTEVAIRAAFKAVQAGRQVAVLCPTTILSEQHDRNFRERLSPFGTKIALINRFTHSAERRSLEDGLKKGNYEIVIGTHSLLGKGIVFKDLGLVVIDEEQKFGVKQKEMLKQLRTEVDVLTLSATPIPRTLSMALMDIRQMSLINDPPPGRLPIRTFVRPYAADVVREAILRELARGGQVFYVYNRVESIGHVAEKLRKLVPTARIGVGHGQMSEKELEPIMVGFIKGEIDILLSTTIVESGLDIPNANTLIVEQADRLGLAQLYQLRGRVGRSDRQAYAYLLYSSSMHIDPSFAALPEGGKKIPITEGAFARLQALQEFSTLGSGYSLAFRDLQIRGAGELLGAKQHGAMVTVGFELYTQLINEAVAQLKNAVDGPTPGTTDEIDMSSIEPLPACDLPAVAFLPESYIREQAQRLYFYQRMMSCRNLEELGEVRGEIEDRYGHPPDEVQAAFAILHLRMRARDLGLSKIDGKGGRLSVDFRDRQSVSPRAISLLGRKNRECYVSKDSLIWPYSGSPISALERFLAFFEDALAQVESERSALGV
jgi:transcription-repair coupling factor (superfamily II helicase)